jgi:stearoyl-CoA desaturase (delta-9 desaturase)
MPIFIFFVAHWYLSLFSQTFLMHRYAAHGSFTMRRGWERFFFVFAYITMGSSYLSPRIYAIMHRMHHAFTDTPRDPHSPKYFSNVMSMMNHTSKVYGSIQREESPIDERFLKNIPKWEAMDRFADSIYSRVGWGLAYLGFYIVFAPSLWWFLLLPVQILMSPVHGAIINWYAHKYGYTNHKLNNTSKNLLPVDVLMLGESYHNDHHQHASSPNFGSRWFEIDPVYYVILVFNSVGIVKLKVAPSVKVVSEF